VTAHKRAHNLTTRLDDLRRIKSSGGIHVHRDDGVRRRHAHPKVAADNNSFLCVCLLQLCQSSGAHAANYGPPQRMAARPPKLRTRVPLLSLSICDRVLPVPPVIVVSSDGARKKRSSTQHGYDPQSTSPPIASSGRGWASGHGGSGAGAQGVPKGREGVLGGSLMLLSLRFVFDASSLAGAREGPARAGQPPRRR
jgi:hypothetical protein